MSKYEAVYFVGDNLANNRIRVDSYKTRNRGAFSGSLAALLITLKLLHVQCFLQICCSGTFPAPTTWSVVWKCISIVK